MAHHDGKGTGLDTGLIGFAVGLHPGVAVHIVDGGHQMLVALVLAVAGEVLDGSRKAQFLHLFHIGFAHVTDTLGVAAEGAGVGDGIAEVGIDINDRSESPIGSNRTGLFGADLGHLGSHGNIVSGSNFHRRTYQSALSNNAVAALFQVGSDQQGHLAPGSQSGAGIDGPLGGHHAVHTAAGGQNAVDVFKLGFLSFLEQDAEQLAALFLHGHAVTGGVYPLDGIIIQEKRVGFQINHGNTSYYQTPLFWGSVSGATAYLATRWSAMTPE